MKKKILFLALALPLLCTNFSYAEESQQSVTNKTLEETNATQLSQSAAIEQPAIQTQAPEQKVAPAESTFPSAQIPELQQPTLNVPTLKQSSRTKKIDLTAVIFDPNADFKAQAEAENREMTKTEKLEYKMHEALHGEVCCTNDIPKNGLLSKYCTLKPKGGILESVNVTNGYKGIFTNAWNGPDYQNTLYNVDSIVTTFDGKFKDKKTSFRSMYLFAPGKDGHDFFNDVWGDQYLQYAWRPQDQILFGYARTAVGLEGAAGPWTLPLVYRSQIAKTYNNARALGVKAQGSHKMYDYSIGVFSAGRYFMDWFPGPEFIASFGVKPLGMTNGKYGKLLLGGGIDSGNAERKYNVGSAYLDYEYKRLNLTAEYGVADGSNGSTGFTTNKSEGLNGTVAYRLTPKLQLLARYDQFDPNKDKKNDIRREYTAGLNYYLKGQNLKLQLNYVYYTLETGTYGSKIVLCTQIIL